MTDSELEIGMRLKQSKQVSGACVINKYSLSQWFNHDLSLTPQAHKDNCNGMELSLSLSLSQTKRLMGRRRRQVTRCTYEHKSISVVFFSGGEIWNIKL